MKKTAAPSSPNAYIASLKGWRKEIASVLRAAAVSTDGLAEEIKWGHLVYFSNGPVLLIRAEDERVLFGFWRGRRLRHLEARLKPGGKYEMATITLTKDSPTDDLDLPALIREGIQLNRSLGDPTKINKASQEDGRKHP